MYCLFHLNSLRYSLWIIQQTEAHIITADNYDEQKNYY